MTDRLTLHIDNPNRPGRLDIASIKLVGYTLISDDELAKLRAAAAGLPDDRWSSTDILHALDLCRHGLTTPDGRTLTRKASAAVTEIDKLLTWKHR